jgi:phosphoglycerate dehydrogenase-like enzyme
VTKVLVHTLGGAAEKIRSALPGLGLGDVAVEAIPTEGPVPDGADGEILVTSAIGGPNLAEVLAATGVTWIHTIGTGVDRFPLHLVGDRTLTCSRGASGIPIAEWVLATMLAFEKRMPAIFLTEPPERWHFAELGGLHGRTLGLVGLGGIGGAVAERALPFGMRVLAVRRTTSPSPVPGVEVVGSLDDVLAAADHLVITAPATAETRHLIDAGALARVKRGLHLVNIARGSLVDQDALRAALDDGRVAMASLDTVDPEPLPSGHWMYDHPGVRLSAHISWSMPGALDALYDAFLDNLGRRSRGEPLLGTVDVAAGY